MRILILGDFQVLDNKFFNIRVEQTFGHILKRNFEKRSNIEVFIIANPFNNSKLQSQFFRLIFDIEQFNPNIVIINLGSVDAGFRRITNAERMLFRTYPKIGDNVFFKLYKRLRFFFISINSIKIESINFSRNYQKIIDHVKKLGATAILINLPKLNINENFLNKILDNRIKKYNEIMEKLAKLNDCILIDLYSLSKEDLKIVNHENYLISKDGHQLLAKKLKKILFELI